MSGRKYPIQMETHPAGWCDWIQPVRRGYRMRCCDCGLVHEFQFRIFGGRIQLRARRDNRATAAIHREQRKRAAK